MTEAEQLSPIEQDITLVDGWIASMSETGEVGEISPAVLNRVLTHFGADFQTHDDQDRAAALDCLIFYSSRSKTPGVRAVWGSAHPAYKQFVAGYLQTLPEYGMELPHLHGKPDVVSEGMMQFLSEMTALAGDSLALNDYRELTGVRLGNGRLVSAGRGSEARKVKVWAVKDRRQDGTVQMDWMKIRPASIPPGFPELAWKFVKDHAQENRIQE